MKTTAAADKEPHANVKLTHLLHVVLKSFSELKKLKILFPLQPEQCTTITLMAARLMPQLFLWVQPENHYDFTLAMSKTANSHNLRYDVQGLQEEEEEIKPEFTHIGSFQH